MNAPFSISAGAPMTIRRAKFQDIPWLLDLAVVAHFASNYAGRCEVDLNIAERFFRNLIAGQTKDSVENGTAVFISEGEDRIEGAIIGYLQRVYFVTDKLEATDLFWYVRPDAPQSTGQRLQAEFQKWAGKIDHVIQIVQANRDAIVDPERSGKLIERSGARIVGHVYVKETTP